ncbi:MAG: DUF378 domain-containing protein [Candidatus Paracaedibacteraceae bacterium]|nr:DUF378 domain-containing protein [Candidatus Paracaedibacteraceae bacterium]
MENKRHLLGVIGEVLVIVGAINWGLVGLFDVNLVNLIFNSYPLLEKSVYSLVGIAGLYILYRLINAEVRSNSF